MRIVNYPLQRMQEMYRDEIYLNTKVNQIIRI